MFCLLLVSFLVSALVIFSDYREKDELYLRRLLQSDGASVSDFVLGKYKELTSASRPEERERGNNRQYNTEPRDKRGNLKQEFG